MALTFKVDGKITQNASTADIEAGFTSIDTDEAGSFTVVELQRPPFILCAFGQPKEGYSLDVREEVMPKGTETSKVTSPASPISHSEVAKIFQAFARNDDSWQKDLQWSPGIGKIPTARVLKRLAILGIFFVLLILVLKYVLKLF